MRWGALIVLIVSAQISSLIFSAIYNRVQASDSNSKEEVLKFPDDFKFGVASAAYQIEGGWNEGGRTPIFWDNLIHEAPDAVVDGSNADIACDSYHKWQEDVNNLKLLKVNHYRFSISWSRLLPDGFIYQINQDGVDYYNNLINGLVENGIEPVVTLYHWDHPTVFSPMGTWTNEGMVQIFADYARLAYQLFGDRVKTWITFNEPFIFCQQVSVVMTLVNPSYPDGIISYMCTKTVLKAHAEAYHIYHDEFANSQNGKVSMSLNYDWYVSASDSRADIEAAEQRRQFEYGIYLNPLVNYGWPEIVKERVANRSRLEGFTKSRLPQFTEEEKNRIHGSYDFFAVNHYTTYLVNASADEPIGRPSFSKDMGTFMFHDPSWPKTGSAANKIVPWGFRQLLNYLKDNYNDPKIFVTECGYADDSGTLEDDNRIDFYKKYLNEVLYAIHEDKCRIVGFTAWNLMDDFEWLLGYQTKYGLYHVDFSSPERTRTPKKSASYYTSIIENRHL